MMAVSDCCGGELAVAGHTTHYYLCGTCGNPCNEALPGTLETDETVRRHKDHDPSLICRPVGFGLCEVAS